MLFYSLEYSPENVASSVPFPFLAHELPNASNRKTIGLTVSLHSFLNVGWTPDRENESADQVGEWGLTDALVLLRLLMQSFPNPIQKVNSFLRRSKSVPTADQHLAIGHCVQARWVKRISALGVGYLPSRSGLRVLVFSRKAHCADWRTGSTRSRTCLRFPSSIDTRKD